MLCGVLGMYTQGNFLIFPVKAQSSSFWDVPNTVGYQKFVPWVIGVSEARVWDPSFPHEGFANLDKRIWPLWALIHNIRA